MTEKQANKRLIEKEEFYFNLDQSSHTSYAAVIKQSLDSKTDDDYMIEVGISNTTIYIDKVIAKISNQILQKEFESKELRIVPTGKAKLQSKKLEKITGGCSIFFEKGDLSSGTAGAFFRIASDDLIYLISNRHVILDENENLDTKVVHPAPIESNGSEKIIGQLCWASDKKSQHLDAAIACVNYPVDIGKFSISPEIKILGIENPKVGDNVRKYGNGSKMTYGEIRSINCTVNVSGNAGGYRLFKNQILTSFMTIDGDSGSALVTDDNKIVGLLFAGDDSRVSYANNIKHIFDKSLKKFREKNISKFV